MHSTPAIEVLKFPKTPRLIEVMSHETKAWDKLRAVAEEKIDGANVGLRFVEGELVLQSRGHVLRGGPGEEQFAALHNWAANRYDLLFEALNTTRMLYGEWCFAKHRAFYDALPDLLIGLDVLDLTTGEFLNTSTRDALLTRAGVALPPRLWNGVFGKAPAFGSLLGKSAYKTGNWKGTLEKQIVAARRKLDEALAETDLSDEAEGVYVRIEDETKVVGRMKLHREGFEKVRSDNWRRKPIIKNVTSAKAST